MKIVYVNSLLDLFKFRSYGNIRISTKAFDFNIIHCSWGLAGQRLLVIYNGYLILEKRDYKYSTMFVDLAAKGLELKELLLPQGLLFDQARGPQNFAYGHLLVDILPLLHSINLEKDNGNLNNLSLPLLLYEYKKWTNDIFMITGNRNISKAISAYIESNLTSIGSVSLANYLTNSPIIGFNPSNLIRARTSLLKEIIKRIPKKGTKSSIIILSRKLQLPRRSLRWINEEECAGYIKDSFPDLNYFMPENIPIKQQIETISSYRLVICAAGSAAYTPLFFSHKSTIVLMVVPYPIRNYSDWGFTLRHFWQHKDRLILVSDNSKDKIASGESWDSNAMINPKSLLMLCRSILKKYEQTNTKEDELLKYVDNSKLYFKNYLDLTLSGPAGMINQL